MCGMFGIVTRKGEQPNFGLLVSATDSLQARGPDSGGHAVSGRVAFGARRPAVIDLNSGGQPVESRCGTVVAMQNGAIYNHKDLRAELLGLGYPLRSSGDTEILTYGYMAWGIDGLLERLDGLYTFAVHDRAQGVVHLARDRMGEKRCFYHFDGQSLVFSSQLLTVARCPNIPFRLNPSAVEAYFALHFVPGEETVLEGIHKLQPAHVLTYRLDSDSVVVRRYWQIEPQPIRPPLHRREATAELRRRVESAVDSRLIGDVPVGAFLSGGIASSAIVACMAERVAGLKTFSVGFEDGKFDEIPYALTVARRFGTDHHHLTFGMKDFEQLIPDVVAAMDEPTGDQALLPALWMARLARQHVAVSLSGEGADEIFAGHDHYQPKMLPDDWRATAYAAFRPFFKPTEVDSTMFHRTSDRTPSGFPLVIDGEARAAILRRPGMFEHSPWSKSFADGFAKFQDPLQAACYTDLVTSLPDNLLVKVDTMAMSASLEGRCPFLQPDLVQWALGLPQRFKVGLRGSKEILRDAFADRLPPEILNRRKHGLNLPLNAFFRSNAGRSMVMDHIDTMHDHGIVRSDRLRTMVTGWLTQPEPPGRNLMALLLYRMWLSHAYRQPKFQLASEHQEEKRPQALLTA
ncbi:asparagine synthase (glutamine-hydrolyzing) [Azospirillum sp. B506]|uniref:asparagine synthase (glutamine-hydrolyzing) n=1 Tax=Azospirillum sp. B506 TaxID=137721 RepID=UPI00034B5706|nr:asparagine synthase (glutamine-hydrolyzing) [Azospirillum sp. B506]